MGRKYRLFLSSFILFFLLSGCGRKAAVWVYLYEIPEGYSLCMTGDLGVRQQYLYKSDDGAKQVVLEAMEENNDSIATEISKQVKIGNKKTTICCYGGEKIIYGGLPAGAEAGMYKPQNGDLIYEWKEKGTYLRLFGNLSENEMLSFVEQVRVRY